MGAFKKVVVFAHTLLLLVRPFRRKRSHNEILHKIYSNNSMNSESFSASNETAIAADSQYSGFDADPFASVPKSSEINDTSDDFPLHNSSAVESDVNNDALKLAQSRGVIVVDDISDLVSLVCGDDMISSSSSDYPSSSARPVHKSIHMYVSRGASSSGAAAGGDGESSDEEAEVIDAGEEDDHGAHEEEEEEDEGEEEEGEEETGNVYVQLGDELGDGDGDEDNNEQFGDFIEYASASASIIALSGSGGDAVLSIESSTVSVEEGEHGGQLMYNTNTDLFAASAAATSTGAVEQVGLTPNIKPLTKGNEGVR